MSNQGADMRERFLSGTLRLVENMEKGKGSASESSSSSDGSNEPNSDHSPPSNFQRPQLTVESGMASFPAISMTQSQQHQGIDLALHSGVLASPNISSQFITRPSAATFGFQNLLGQAGIGSNSFDPMELQNMAIQKRAGLDMGLSFPPRFEGINPTDSNGKMKMTWEDNILGIPNLHSLNLLSQGQGSQAQRYGFPFNRYFMRNTVYDPMYEAMGLPIDPHIRMFIARRDNGDEGH